MAEIMGIGVGSLNKIEQGIFHPRLDCEVFYHLHRQFGIRTSELFRQK
ncbi:MAG: hypothetical protein IJ043_06140 [Clostridia bacterium]|nr:hypothetical protein [Clostridia bacterium]